jgi:hypothetical protein
MRRRRPASIAPLFTSAERRVNREDAKSAKGRRQEISPRRARRARRKADSGTETPER